MVEIFVRYEGGLRCLSTHGPSGEVLPSDAPADNMGRGLAFSPTDLAATSLAACMLTTMAIAAQKKSLPVDLGGAKACVKKHMTPTSPRRIAKLEVDLEIPGVESGESRKLLEETALNCPVALSLHPEVQQVVSFRWVG